MLRDCPDVKHVYMLARGRKGVPPRNRVDELLDNTVRHCDLHRRIIIIRILKQ